MRILVPAALSLLLCTALAAQVANDECTGAVAVSSGTNGPFQNVGATQSLPTWPCNAGFGTDVWFVYVPSCNGTATFDTCGAFFDTVMQVFEVGACSGNSCANRFAAGGPCNNDWCGQQSRVTMSVAADCRYYIRVAGAGALWGTFPLNINCTGAAAGPLDERCSGATPVVTGTNGPFSNVGYATSPPQCQCLALGATRWFSYRASFTGPHTISTCTLGTNYVATQVDVYSGTCCNLVNMGCDVYGCGSGAKLFGLPFVQGQTYYIRVGGSAFNNLRGEFALTVHTGTGLGSFTTMATACRGAAHTGIYITVKGNPNIGGSVTVLSSSYLGAVPFIGYGFQTSPFPAPFACCTIGHDFTLLVPGISSTLPIPLDPALIGGSFYTQGVALQQASGCQPDPNINFSNTVKITIG